MYYTRILVGQSAINLNLQYILQTLYIWGFLEPTVQGQIYTK